MSQESENGGKKDDKKRKREENTSPKKKLKNENPKMGKFSRLTMSEESITKVQYNLICIFTG